VMGLTWIAEIISWILLHFYPVSVTIVKASLFFDCLNALQGFTLFCALFFGRVSFLNSLIAGCYQMGRRHKRVVPLNVLFPCLTKLQIVKRGVGSIRCKV